MLLNIIDDPEIRLTTQEMELEPLPFFAQLVYTDTHPVEEEIPENQIEEMKVFLPLLSPYTSLQLYESTEVKDVLHGILQDFIFNLMTEAQLGKFNIFVASDTNKHTLQSALSNTVSKIQPNRNVTFAD